MRSPRFVYKLSRSLAHGSQFTFAQRAHGMNAIPDYFRTQRAWMLLTGVWPPITSRHWTLRVAVTVARLVFQTFLFLVMLHVAIVYLVAFYLEAPTASYARITYCLSQAVIFSFAAFSTFYFQFRADACKQMMDNMNGNFHFRSAKGGRVVWVSMLN